MKISSESFQQKKEEPEFLLEFRLKAYRKWTDHGDAEMG